MMRTLAVSFFCAAALHAQTADFSMVPGVVIAHSPAASGLYIGSPSIVVLPGGDYLAAHDYFGPKSNEHVSAVSHVYHSSDRGKSWKHLSKIQGAFWSTLFEHKGDVYFIGTTAHHGNMVIRRSRDGGKTWTEPRDKTTGLLREGQFHCAPVPVVTHNGRLWRGFEDAAGGKVWGKRYRAMMMSAPVESDLLHADNWTASNFLPRDPEWLGGKFNAWLEGNAVVTPTGKIVDILRVDTLLPGGRAARVEISDDGKTASFDPAKGFLHFPGGAVKFAIRRDPVTKRYWSLTNHVPEKFADLRPAATRNTLALISSPDLESWTVNSIVLQHPDPVKHAFQYVDWLFDGDDLIAVSRTAYDDGLGGALRAHDANFLTFHRIVSFRKLTMK
jgi:hypothetical protein